MTHTNHRQGNLESLSKDYVVLIVAARGINNSNIEPKFQEFLSLGFKYGAVNAGTGPGANMGNMFTSTREKLIEQLSRSNSVSSVFDNKEKAAALVKELVKADLGLSVVVSGLFKEVDQMCRTAGIKRHTALCSLGVWGNRDKLPEDEILDITTMCGHNMLAANLVRRMAARVKEGLIDIEEAAGVLAKPCVCGVFNPKRAQELLQQHIDNAIGNNGPTS